MLTQKLKQTQQPQATLRITLDSNLPHFSDLVFAKFCESDLENADLKIVPLSRHKSYYPKFSSISL